MKNLILILTVSTALSCCKEVVKSPLPQNILILGNSITVHPVIDYWWGEWGMAASVRENDFVHRLQSKIRAENSKCDITPKNIGDWERNHKTFNLSDLDSFFETLPDLVILRIGENVGDISGFDVSLQTLLYYIKTKSPNSKILITGVFWHYKSIENILKEVARNNGVDFVKLVDLDTEDNRSSIGSVVYDTDGNQHTINNSGVAKHPNDKGMGLIAERIFSAINIQ